MLKLFHTNAKGDVKVITYENFYCDFKTGKIYDEEGKEAEIYLKNCGRIFRYFVVLKHTYFTGRYYKTVTSRKPLHQVILHSSPGFEFKEGYVIHHINRKSL